jgi:hypothetical protein
MYRIWKMHMYGALNTPSSLNFPQQRILLYLNDGHPRHKHALNPLNDKAAASAVTNKFVRKSAVAVPHTVVDVVVRSWNLDTQRTGAAATSRVNCTAANLRTPVMLRQVVVVLVTRLHQKMQLGLHPHSAYSADTVITVTWKEKTGRQVV